MNEVGKAERVVFTDMDATLLYHESYGFEAALPALGELKRRHIPLVLCSSKTLAELLVWQERLGIEGPLIVENGGGVFLTGMEELTDRMPRRLRGLPAKVLGTSYDEIRQALKRIGAELGVNFTGFGDLTVEEVGEVTGLYSGDAALAHQRDFDEPFLWPSVPEEAQMERFYQLAREEGLKVTRGGRFWHLMGDSDKGRAVRWVLDTLFFGAKSLALGDSENDLEMLAEADSGVLVERHGGGHLAPTPVGIRCVEGVGPEGWNRAVLQWLDDLIR